MLDEFELIISLAERDLTLTCTKTNISHHKESGLEILGDKFDYLSHSEHKRFSCGQVRLKDRFDPHNIHNIEKAFASFLNNFIY